MKILIDIGHPAHVHIFRNLAMEMTKEGHSFLFTCREKENVIALLEAYKLDYKSFGKPFRSKLGKISGLMIFNLKMLRQLLRFKPDITLGHSSMYAAQMSWLLRIPHISVEDTGNMEQIRLYKPFTKAILVPDSFHRELGSRQIRYKGNHELAYLHPSRFIPDPSVAQAIEDGTSRPVAVLRFVAWNASHDAGHTGISLANKVKAVKEFSRYARVLISSEKPLPAELEAYKITLAPEKIHSLIALASLVYGESATMASEASMLGTPAIYLDNTGRCYTREEEDKYGLVFNYSESEADQLDSILKGTEILQTRNIREQWSSKHTSMMKDKIDVTAFLMWFVKQWPESFRTMKNNPEYQDIFISQPDKTHN